MLATVNAGELHRALVQLKKAVDARTSIPVLAHVLLTVVQTDLEFLYLTATDLEVSLTIPVRTVHNRVSDGSICISAAKLCEIAATYRTLGERLTLEIPDDGQLKISNEDGQTVVRGLPSEDFPVLPVLDHPTTSELEPESFYRALENVFPAISKEESRFQLSGALLAPHGELIATDGHRLNAQPFELSGEKREGVLVPRQALRLLKEAPAAMRAEGAIRFETSDRHLSFTCNRWRITARILEGTFPDYERVIAKPGPMTSHVREEGADEPKVIQMTECKVDPVRFLKILKAVSTMTGDRSRAVRGEMNGRIKLSAANPDLGESEFSCPVLESNGGDTGPFGMNPDYLMAVCKAAGKEPLRLNAWDENHQLVAYGLHGLRAVIMPLRI